MSDQPSVKKASQNPQRSRGDEPHTSRGGGSTVDGGPARPHEGPGRPAHSPLAACEAEWDRPPHLLLL